MKREELLMKLIDKNLLQKDTEHAITPALKGICYIIGACGEFSSKFSLNCNENDLIIAADGGYDTLKVNGIKPDILLGDFDSITEIPEHIKLIEHPVKKDDTDTFLAYKTAFSKGYKNFVILGGVGGRIDHTIANIQTLLNIAKNGGRGFLIGQNNVMTTIFNSSIEFSEIYTGNLGVFAQGNDAYNVTISGLKYAADNITIKSDTPIGVSNEFIGDRAVISVKNGSILVVWDEKLSDFLSHINNFCVK